MTSRGRTVLWGRDRERAVVEQVLRDLRSGHSRALVLRGEPGIGKTLLLDEMAAHADGAAVLRLSGVQSEGELAYGALHAVWSQLSAGVSRLPEPQQTALRITFGLESGPAPSPLLVGLAVLNGLADVAEQQPLLILVDDAQWLDHASAKTLGFVARRLQAEGIGLVFAVREAISELEGLLELPIAGLAAEDAERVLAPVLAGQADQVIVERFIAETGGNPLALLELSHGLALAQWGETFDRADARDLWVRLEENFQRRAEALSPAAQMLMLIAAAEPLGDPLLLWRAADLLGVPRGSAGELEEAGLMHAGPHVVFRHPLVRSAAYRFAPGDARRSVHRALADVTDRQADPDRRAWHRARAASGPDEDIAAELERSASRALGRGGFAAAAAFLERALTLTLDADRRGPRALAAGQAKLAAGEPRAARSLAMIAESASLDEAGAARLGVLRARIAFALGRGRDAPALLLRSARSLEPLDPAGAVDAYLDAMQAVLFAGSFATGTHLGDVAAAGRAVAWPQVPRIPDLLLRAYSSLIADGYAVGAPLARQAVAALRRGGFTGPQELEWLALGTQLAVTLWDMDGYDDLTARQLGHARATGALDVLPIALTNRAIAHILTGELTAAASLTEEIEVASEATGTPLPPYAVVATAIYGPPAPALALIDSCLRTAEDRGEGGAVKWILLEKAVLCNALGRYEDAWTAAVPAYQDPVLYSAWIGSELVESAARTGRPELAARALENLDEMALAAGTDWVLGVRDRSQALLTDSRPAEDLYQRSIAHLQRAGIPVELARSRLVYGEWLRRDGRRTDARQQLRAAREAFSALGAAAFTDRAARELAAAGDPVQDHLSAGGSSTGLTVREAQIARLAGDGLSNRQIGEQLFISHRTVGYHLAKVFSKLGVNSRALIGDALRTAAAP